MLERKVDIINKLGMHARAATKFTGVANRYGARVDVCVEDKTIDGKSIMALMLLAAAKGTSITIRTEGDDEADCLAALVELVNNRFDEGE